MPQWKRNLYVLAFAQLVTMIGFSGYHPFVAYYLMDLGIPTYEQAASWLAGFQSGAAISMMIASPIWGALADRHGRRLMLIRATAAGCLFTFLMSLSQTPMHLLILRVIQGLFSGTVPAATTLAATETPEENLGYSLGLMETIRFVGQTLGPLLGGIAADLFGYRNVFRFSAILMLISLTTIITLVKETKHPKPTAATSRKRARGGALAALTNRSTVILVLTLAGNSFAISTLSPILSLYIKSLIGDNPNLGTIAGAIISVTAFTSSLSAIILGRLADKIGQKPVLLASIIGVALIHVPQAMVTTPYQLLALRAIQGIFMGGIMPTANSLLARTVESSRRGAVYGFSHSAQAGGRVVGPTLGATISNTWGMPSTFLATAGIFASLACLVAAFVRIRLPEKEKTPELTPQ